MKIVFKQFLEKQLRYSLYFYNRLRAVQELENLSSTELVKLQQKKLIFLLQKAYRSSPFYASLYKKHRVDINKIKSVQDLQYLPVITKHEVVEHREAIFIGNKWNKKEAYSSGTSGLTVRVYRDYQSIVEEGAYQWAHRMKFGHRPGMKTVILRGNLHLQERERYDPFTKTLYLSSYHLHPQNAEWYYQRIKDFAPNAIFAYPSSLESLANFFMVLGKSLHVPVIFTSSETLYSYQRIKIEKVFESRIIDWYGNAERTIALKEEEDGLYSQVPLYSVNEFKQDHIITTSLINASFPLIRYKMDDVMVLEKGSQKFSFEKKIEKIHGRKDDVLLLPDGTRVGMMCNAFDGIDHILLSQVVQKDLNSIQINMVVSERYSHAEERVLKKQIEEIIGTQAPYQLRYVDEEKIIKSGSGKFKLVVNKMRDDKRSSPHPADYFAG